MDDLKHLQGKAVRSIEQNNSGLNSYLIIRFTDDSKFNVSGYPHGDHGVAQLDIELDGIKLPEIKNSKISTIEEEFDGQMDKLIIKFKQGGRMVIGAFNSKEDGTAGLETTVYVENKKKLVGESLKEAEQRVLENQYKDGRWGNYIMNSPQYEEEDPAAETQDLLPEEEEENNEEEMKKFVGESLNEFADWYDTEPVEYDDEEEMGPSPEDLHGDVTVSHGEAPPYKPIGGMGNDLPDDDDELSMDDVSDVAPEADEEEIKTTKIFEPEADDEIEISGVDYDEVESRISNLLKSPEFSRDPLEFRLKSGEEIVAKPMAKMRGGTAVLFKTEDGGLLPIALSDIILESKKSYKWVEESLDEAKKRKIKPPLKKGPMKMVKVDDRTTIEVPEDMSNEEAIKKHKEKMAARSNKW
jgi:hypothetical protein